MADSIKNKKLHRLMTLNPVKPMLEKEESDGPKKTDRAVVSKPGSKKKAAKPKVRMNSVPPSPAKVQEKSLPKSTSVDASKRKSELKDAAGCRIEWADGQGRGGQVRRKES